MARVKTIYIGQIVQLTSLSFEKRIVMCWKIIDCREKPKRFFFIAISFPYVVTINLVLDCNLNFLKLTKTKSWILWRKFLLIFSA